MSKSIGIFSKLIGFSKNNTATLLTATSVLGLVATTALAVNATVKATRIIDNEDYISPKPLELVDYLRLTWKEYVPVVLVGGLTISSMIWSNSIHVKRTAALASVYSLSESRLKSYRKQLLTKLGPKKVTEIDDEVAKEKLHSNPIKEDDASIINTGRGDVLCYDALSGRYFRSDIENIRSVLNKLSRDMLSETFVPLNSVYSELGLRGIKLGDDIGWHIDDGMLDPNFSAQLTDKNTPCLVLDFYTEPRYVNW